MYRNPMEGWRAIAKKLIDEGRVYSGLCWEIKCLGNDLDGQARTFMHRQLRELPDLIYPVGHYAEERAMLAVFLAEHGRPQWRLWQAATRRNNRIKQRLAEARHARQRADVIEQDKKFIDGQRRPDIPLSRIERDALALAQKGVYSPSRVWGLFPGVKLNH